MNNAKKVVKQIVREPVEIFKQAEKQVFSGETPEIAQEKTGQTEPPTVSPQKKAEIEAQGARRLQALEAEMADIRALKAEKKVEEPKKEEPAKPLVEPATRPRRGWGAKLKQLKTQTETRLPPSG